MEYDSSLSHVFGRSGILEILRVVKDRFVRPKCVIIVCLVVKCLFNRSITLTLMNYISCFKLDAMIDLSAS